MSMSNYSTRARELVLASVLSSYPDEDAVGALRELGGALGQHVASSAASQVATDAGADDLRSRFIDLFERGGQRASLYETEYGRMRGMSKGNDLADIAGFYAAFGLNLDPSSHETPDHVAVELEFYAMLLLKQEYLDAAADAEGADIVLDGRRKFLRDHLGSFAPAIAARPDVATDPMYGPIFRWVGELVTRECGAVGVEPTPLDYFADAEGREEMKCGSVHLPIVS